MTAEHVPTHRAVTGVGPDPGAGGAAGGPAGLVIVSRDAGVRKVLERELAKRYGADYQIEVCDHADELAARMQALREAGAPVALVVGGIGGLTRQAGPDERPEEQGPGIPAERAHHQG